MVCRNCGRNNSAKASHCAYCGAPLVRTNENQKKIIIIALCAALLLSLTAMAGVLMYKDAVKRNRDFDSDETLPSPTVSATEIPVSTEGIEEEKATEKPKKTETPNPRKAKKDAFLDKADTIDGYDKTYLEPAETQSEINRESGIVAEKWDKLLNEVYQYLKTIMPDSDFKRLQQDEIAWIAEKEQGIEEAGAEWGGGSGEPMARNFAAIRYTKERCYYLISLIN